MVVDFVRMDLLVARNDFSDARSVDWRSLEMDFNKAVKKERVDLAFSSMDADSFWSPSSSHRNILTRDKAGFIRKGWSSYAMARRIDSDHFALEDNDDAMLLLLPLLSPA